MSDQTAFELISRTEAKARGLTTFFHGRPCKRGHIAPRSVASQYCCECRRVVYHADPKHRERKRLVYWKEGGKEDRRARNLKAQYGISIEQYNAMALSQDFRCAICNEFADLGSRRLVVDHDHKTNKLRSLLCHKCNVGLGSFKDDPRRLQQAISYLNKHGG